MVILGFLVLILVIGGWLVSRVKKNLGLMTGLKRETEQLQEKTVSLKNLTESYQVYEPSVFEWEKWFPRTEEEVAKFASEAEKLAADSGVILEVDFDDFPEMVEVGGEKMKGLKIEWTLKGDYPELVKFLGGLEKMKYLVQVNKIFLTKGKQINTKLDMTIEGILLMKDL